MVIPAEGIEPKKDGTIETIEAILPWEPHYVYMGDGEVEPIDHTVDIEVYWHNGNAIRYYHPPDKEKLGEKEYLQTLLGFMNNFELRFMKNADSGLEAYESDRGIAVLENNLTNERNPYEERAGKGTLAVAIYKNALAKAKSHIQYRIDGGPNFKETLAILGHNLSEHSLEIMETKINLRELQQEALDKLKREAAEGFMAVVELFENVKRAGGKKDYDGVLAEMRGEPYNIFMGSLEDGEGYFNDVFLKNRYAKISSGFDSIDKIREIMAKLINSNPILKETRLKDTLYDLAEAAKSRSETMRMDYPEYSLASNVMRAARDEICELRVKDLPGAEHMSSEQKDGTKKELRLLRKGVRIIYDTAHIRMGKPKEVEEFEGRIEKIIKKATFAEKSEGRNPNSRSIG